MTDKTWRMPSTDEKTVLADQQGFTSQETIQEVKTPHSGIPSQLPSVGTPGETVILEERPKPVFAWLAVLDGPPTVKVGEIHQLNPGTTTIGRVPGNNIVIPDDTCSAQHAKIKIEKNEDGEEMFVLYDLASTNGTFVGTKDDYKDEKNRIYRHELKDGDYILIGETTLVFKKV